MIHYKMIHIIPDFAVHKNWIINKCRGTGNFSAQFANIIDYVSRATLASIPECKQKPLIISFHRVYPKQMKSISGQARSFFVISKGPIPENFNSPYKLGSIYICTAILQKEAEGNMTEYFARIVVRSILGLLNINSLQKEDEILRLFK